MSEASEELDYVKDFIKTKQRHGKKFLAKNPESERVRGQMQAYGSILNYVKMRHGRLRAKKTPESQREVRREG